MIPPGSLNDFEKQGYGIIPDFLSRAEVETACQEAGVLFNEGKFSATGVGQNDSHFQSGEIRKDKSFWFEPHALTQTQKGIWDKLDLLRLELNQTFVLGAFSLEGHYSVYPVGAFYKRHLDQFKGDSRRVVSMVVYLNSNWVPGAGGELVLYTPEGARVVEPLGGTLVYFLSDRMEHEVLPTHKTRFSFAGWFRRTGE